MALALAGQAVAEPASIRDKRAQVARIEAELGEIDAQVGRAAEEYNGARYRLGIVLERIEANRRALSRAERNLARARSTLSRRVREIYRQGEPSLAEVLLGSRSIVAAVDQVDLLARIGRQDAFVVTDIREFRTRTEATRARLAVDRGEAKTELRAAQRHKVKVEGLLRRRQAVLSQARGDLAQLLAEERARQARIAEQARQRALAAQRAAEAARQQAAAAAAAAPTPEAAPGISPPAADPADPADPVPAPTATLPAAGGNASVVSIAMGYLGVPYVWGGASPSGFDCSGLASFCYAQIGKSVPHYTVAIYNAFPKVPYDQLQPGDLVFFNGLGHMGIYIGGGQMVNAPRTGDVVKVSSIARGDYVGAVRP